MTEMNRKNLRKRPGGSYAVVYYVPTEMREVVGKREIVRGLGTSDQKEAMRLKPAMLLEIAAEVHRLVSAGVAAGAGDGSGFPDSGAPIAADSWIPVRYGTGRREPSKLGRTRPAALRRGGSNSYVIDKDRGLIMLNGKEVSTREPPARHPVAGRASASRSKNEILIDDAIEQWRSTWSGINLSTQRRYNSTLTKFSTFFPGRALVSISRRDAVSYVYHMRNTLSVRTGRLLSTKSISHETIIIFSFFKASRLLGLIPSNHDNPFKDAAARLPGQKQELRGQKDLRAITREEAIRFLSAARARGGHYAFEMEAIIRLLWATGARASDIAALERDKVRDDGDLIWMNVRSKTDAGNRGLCLVGEPERELVREALKRADTALAEEDIPEENRDLLFPRLRRGGDDRKPYWYVGRSLLAVRDQTFGKGVPWDMHSFRRTATAALENAGVSPNARNIVIGHSTKEDIGFDIYAKKGPLWNLIERTLRTLYDELGGSL